MHTNPAPEGLRAHIVSLLDGMRQAAAKNLADDLQTILHAAQASPSSDPLGLPDNSPEWVRFAFPYAVMPGGAVCWGSVKALLSVRTAQLMAAAQTPENLSGCFLADQAGIDLYGFASEVWENVAPASTLPAAGGPV